MNKKFKNLVLLAVSFLTLFLLYHVIYYPLKAHSEPFHLNGQLSKSAQNIFAQVHQQITTLQDANSFAQKKLLRSGERWHEQNNTGISEVLQENSAAIIQHLQNLGMIDQIKPQKKQYLYAGVMGALKTTVAKRMAYLQELIDCGLSFDYIVLLGGARPLLQKEKTGLPEHITTEAEMMVYLFNNSSLKNNKMIIVDAPLVKKPDGTITRPTTDQTLVNFTKIAPQEGSFLVVSNNPYILRQTKVAERILDKKRFPVEGVGAPADMQNIDIVMLMDEFARTLYEEFKEFSCQ
ncbi:MAG: hypothetical protein K2X90_02375 [Candidatus Babeliaceae bacterium]|nr:hypothetical protein [Candidatus Babeliaceae bacterium]